MDLRELIEKARIHSGADMTADEKLNYIASQDDSTRTLPREPLPEFIMSPDKQSVPDLTMPQPPQGLPPVGTGTIPPAFQGNLVPRDMSSPQQMDMPAQDQIDPEALKSAVVRQQLTAKSKGEQLDPERARKRALLMNSLLRGVSKVAQHGGVHGSSVRPDLSYYDRAEQRLRGEDEASISSKNTDRGNTSAQSLRKEFNSLPVVKATGIISQQVSKMAKVWDYFLKTPNSKNRSGVDQAIIISFNKMLDPGSVVRESEYARTGAGQAALQKLEGFWQKMKAGGAGITDQEREEIMQVAGKLYRGQLSDYEKAKNMYTNEANILGYDPERIIMPLGKPRDFNLLDGDTSSNNVTPKGITGKKISAPKEGTTRMWKTANGKAIGNPYDIPNDKVEYFKKKGMVTADG